MPFPTGLGSAVGFSVAATLAAVPAYLLLRLGRAGRSGSAPGRSGSTPGDVCGSGDVDGAGGYVAVAAGAAIGAVGLASLAVALPITGGRGSGPVVTAAITLSLAVLAVAGGVLWLPAVVHPAARTARVLDGLLLTACVAYVLWALYLRPWRGTAEADEAALPAGPHWAVLVLPVLLVSASIGIQAVNLGQLRRSRSPAVLMCVGAGLFSLGSGALLLGTGALLEATGAALGATGALIEGSGSAAAARLVVPLLAVGAAGLVAGCVTMAGAALRATGGSASTPIAAQRGESGLSSVAVAVALGACIARMVTIGDMDPVSIYIAVAIGGLLAAQQGLARRAISRYADRLAASEAHFRLMAYTDALTGLANRRELLRTLQGEAARGRPCVLLAVDLDGFKNINDIRGHDVGDEVLTEVAHRLRSNVRPGDCAVRLGGDEFAVLLWAPPTEASAVADRILSVLNRPYELSGGTVFVSASIGLAGRGQTDSIDSLLRNADLALRFAKQSGKNRVEAYDLAYDELVRRRTALEQELRGAVDRGELMLVYQPVVALSDGRVAGVEALLRWHHPELGSVPPAEFIPLAEEMGLIHGLGSFVVHEACHQLSRWLADGHDVWLSVNASVRELHTPEYARQVAGVLRKHRVPADRLVIEVTEHAVALDVAQLAERISALRSGGVRVALDDFGSGYSSLNLLRTLPVDSLKIDRVLLESEGEPGSAPLVDLVVTLGRRLGLEVVAEGVTTSAQRALLASCGCGLAQGELFGGPLPAERVEALFPPVPGGRPGDATRADHDATRADHDATRADHDATRADHSVGVVDSGREIRQS